jgi:succinylglutamate desuccinylase
MTLHIKQLDYLPEEIYDIDTDELVTVLPEPTLIHLAGKAPEPLFISVLLHGNEPTGFLAIQALLSAYRDKPLPRSLSIFFGNVSAAEHGERHLAQQPDFNRIWPGTFYPECEQTMMAKDIVNIMKRKKVFASIDVHNNTGLNPHYACINKLDNKFLQLANLFGRLTVYFTRPKGVQSSAFAEICPAVTLECGRPDQPYGVEHAYNFIESCMHLHEIPDKPVHHQDIDLFHTVAQVKMLDGTDFSFTDTQAPLVLDDSLEKLNFTEISPGTRFGIMDGQQGLPLIAFNESGQEVTDRYFSIENNQLQVIRSTMPSMLTLDEQVIKQDCLCYLMERITVG